MIQAQNNSGSWSVVSKPLRADLQILFRLQNDCPELCAFPYLEGEFISSVVLNFLYDVSKRKMNFYIFISLVEEIIQSIIMLWGQVSQVSGISNN